MTMSRLVATATASDVLGFHGGSPAGLTIERYRSMDDLPAFSNSPGYKDALTLREGLVEMHFSVAIEGR